jgi:Flp pilus assembly pilin Flp
MGERIRAAWADEDGLTTVEYALLVALVVVSAIAVWSAFGSTVRGKVATGSSSMNAIT